MLTLVYVLFVYSHKVTYFFMACLVLKACNFCVAGLMISSDGETNFCSLIHGQQCKVWCCMYMPYGVTPQYITVDVEGVYVGQKFSDSIVFGKY